VTGQGKRDGSVNFVTNLNVERLIEQTAQDGSEKSGANFGWKEM
jgi:hypothetical protein